MQHRNNENNKQIPVSLKWNVSLKTWIETINLNAIIDESCCDETEI